MCQKERHIYSFLEPLVLYWLLFLPGAGTATVPEGIIRFNPTNILNGLLLHTLPALILVLYLLKIHDTHKKMPFDTAKTEDLLQSFFILCSLLAIVIVLSFISSLFPTLIPAAPRIEAPSSMSSWLLVAFSSFLIAYLEESYFRVYLLQQFNKTGIPKPAVYILSCTLFALCHLYEGIFGFINAFFAALVLSYFYQRYWSLHSIAWAHALYNLTAYVYAIN